VIDAWSLLMKKIECPLFFLTVHIQSALYVFMI